MKTQEKKTKDDLFHMTRLKRLLGISHDLVKQNISFLSYFNRFFDWESRLPWLGPPTIARNKIDEYEKLYNVCTEEEIEIEDLEP